MLVPRPSYPLFEHLTRLDGVAARAYRLEYHGRWEIDVDGLAAMVDARTRAVLLVSPNNPTGSFVRRDELAAVRDVALRHGLAIVCDEVFEGYPMEEVAGRSGALVAGGTPAGRSGSLVADTGALTFTLGGLSKSAGLPQLKLGWILMGGPGGLVARARARLELVCDTYLSVATPVQLAAGALLERSRPVADAILERVRTNHAGLRRLPSAFPRAGSCGRRVDGTLWCRCRRSDPRRTWLSSCSGATGCTCIPATSSISRREAFLVLSLLPPPDVFTGARRGPDSGLREPRVIPRRDSAVPRVLR